MALEEGLAGVAQSGVTAADSRAHDRPVQLGDVLAERYRLDEAIGAGGMGWVFRAFDLRLQREVAIKVLLPSVASDPSMRVRFDREALAATRMTSPHVVTVHDYGETRDGILYLVMELLEGESLLSYLHNRSAPDTTESLRIATGIARGVAHAHEAGVAHRDLKPANVFLTASGLIKVLDFGIAKILEGDGSPASVKLTRTGTMMGTPLYMAPEAVRREAVGQPADLYALGLIVHALITGRPPFFHKVPEVLMTMHLQTSPPRLRDACTEPVTASLETLVLSLLSKDPAARPNVRSVLDALEREAGATPATKPPRPPLEPNASLHNLKTALLPEPVSKLPTEHAAAEPEPRRPSGRQIASAAVALAALAGLGLVGGASVSWGLRSDTGTPDGHKSIEVGKRGSSLSAAEGPSLDSPATMEPTSPVVPPLAPTVERSVGFGGHAANDGQGRSRRRVPGATPSEEPSPATGARSDGLMSW